MSESRQQQDSNQELCQNQVENLLKAMESIEGGSQCSTDSQRPSPAEPAGYDLEVDADLMAAVGWLHESVARDLTETLSEILRTAVAVNVAQVGTIVLESFPQPAKDHHWHSVLSPETIVGDWHFDVTPELCCVIVDRMLGGDPAEGETFTRPMTEIECRLMERVVDGTLETLQQGWQKAADVCWLVRHNEEPFAASDARRLDFVQIRFDVALCRNRGEIRLRIPVQTIESLGPQLRDRSWRFASTATAGPRQRVARNVAVAPIDVVATLARSTIRTCDLLDLNVGDIIATEKAVDEPLELTIQNVPKFKIRAGSLKGKKAIQIETTIESPDGNEASTGHSILPSKESGK